MNSPLKALVAGGAGFLGSHLCDALLKQGYEVTALDNLLSGSAANVKHLHSDSRFTLIEDEAENALALTMAFALVFHLASPASPPQYMAHPIATLHAGSHATEALIAVAQRDNARFILASTSEVYGDPQVHPQPESYWGNVNPIGPRSVYDEAKRYAEALTTAYRRSHQVNTGIARIFNTYGPRMDRNDGRAVPAFISATLAGEPLPLHGDGNQTRSLTFVTDLIDGIMRLAHTNHAGPINLGNPREQTLNEIAQLILELTGSQGGVAHKPRPVDDPERRSPDITLAREILDWTPKVSAEDGLSRTIHWFAQQ
jgi:dTDP-glucose 4,6-dehydratase